MFMPKKPVSVTLEEDNLVWLRGRAASAKRRSLSEALDDVVTAARRGGHAGDARSVVGTVDIATHDPELGLADDVLRDLFGASISRPFLVRDAPPPFGASRRASKQKTRHG
jgi:hypothetical protein